MQRGGGCSHIFYSRNHRLSLNPGIQIFPNSPRPPPPRTWPCSVFWIWRPTSSSCFYSVVFSLSICIPISPSLSSPPEDLSHLPLFSLTHQQSYWTIGPINDLSWCSTLHICLNVMFIRICFIRISKIFYFYQNLLKESRNINCFNNLIKIFSYLCFPVFSLCT